ncbi:MAG: hypothetical protein M3388_14860 [Acidobacteriota bacterium]|nr:hypothetical protein [Acidobacteriota bacterium]
MPVNSQAQAVTLAADALKKYSSKNLELRRCKTDSQNNPKDAKPENFASFVF